MRNKAIILLEVIIVIIMFAWYISTTLIPELKQKFGSSDTFINSNLYNNMVELNIDDTNFILVLNIREKIYHIFFLESTSLVLYNKNIENNTIEDSINRTVELLIENDILKQDSSIVVTRYNDKSYDTFINSFKSTLNKYHIDKEIIEKENTIDEKARELGISKDLLDFDYYSKNISGIGKTQNNTTQVKSSNYKELSKNVYKKIEEYVYNNNIDNLAQDNSELLITYIPCDKSLKYYPTNSSWYYVENKKIYAYIEIDIDGIVKGYCYQGSIDLRSEGECAS